MVAVVRIAGKQYIVAKDSVIDVDHIAGNEGDSLTLNEVLLTENDGKVVFGTPVLDKSSVKATILKQYRGEKISVRRYKSKVRYRKANGFRHSLTQLRIDAIA